MTTKGYEMNFPRKGQIGLMENFRRDDGTARMEGKWITG